MTAQSPDPSIAADTVPGRRGALAAGPSQAVRATGTPGGALPLSATERTRLRRYRQFGRADRDSLYAVLEAGLVLARSVFEHTINYRSAIIYGQPRLVTDPAERLAGLRIITEHVAPGQWDYARQPSRKDLAAVRLLALPLEEASVKIRTGPPSDGDSPDAALGRWAGELPLATTWQQPVPDPALPPGTPIPPHIRSRAGTRADRSPGSNPES